MGFLIRIIDLNELFPESQYNAPPEIADCGCGKCSVERIIYAAVTVFGTRRGLPGVAVHSRGIVAQNMKFIKGIRSRKTFLSNGLFANDSLDR